jgi:hypothetical protein
MANNVTALNATGVTETVRTTETAGVHTSHHILQIGTDPISATNPVPVVENDFLDLTFTPATSTATLFSASTTAGYRACVVQLTGTWTGTVTWEVSNDNTTWVVATAYQPGNPGSSGPSTTATGNGVYIIRTAAKFVRGRVSAYTSGTVEGTVTLRADPAGVLGVNASLSGSTSRIGFAAGGAIWYDDTSTALGANATFTGSSRDLTATAAASPVANAGAYPSELRVSAEADVAGTLWLEASRDNTTWRRVKSVPTAAVTGGGQYAEIIHRPSWRYARVGFTNGATAQARLTVGTIGTAI